jgi:DNA-binding NtrC family response regulator
MLAEATTHSVSRLTRVMTIGDDADMRGALGPALSGAGFEAVEATSREDALARAAASPPELVIMDLESARSEGFVEALKRTCPSLPILVVSDDHADLSAVQAFRCGAVDLLERPLDRERVVSAVNRAVSGRRADGGLIDRCVAATCGAVGVVAKSGLMRNVYRTVLRAAASSRTTVLIEGESGVGKEHVARMLHSASSRWAGPFVALNCAALPETLLEAELFGYEKGAFSGATARKPGLIETANGGTLLLDEIGEMSLGLQAKLLRALQERSFLRVGGIESVSVDVRIVASTNRDLEAAVREGQFRGDLYYRLNVVRVRVPSLRERPSDILGLARGFLQGFAREVGNPLRGFTKTAVVALLAYSWPGNVRELENMTERAAVLSRGPLVRRSDLGLPPPAAPKLDAPATGQDGSTVERTLEDVERAHLARVLYRCQGNRSHAAAELGIHRTTLAKKIRDYGL